MMPLTVCEEKNRKWLNFGNPAHAREAPEINVWKGNATASDRSWSRAASLAAVENLELLTFLFFGQLDLRRFELLLDFGLLFLVHLGSNRLVPLLDRALPVRCRQFETAGLLIQVSQVLLHRGVATHVLRGLAQVVLCEIVFAQLEVCPTQ